MTRRPNRNNPPARREPPPQEQPQPDLVRQDIWQGPLPPPAAIEHFERMVPDAGQRIFDEWQREAAHRRDIEKTGQRGNLSIARLGQIGAIILVLAVLSVGALGFWLGYPKEAAAIVISVVGSVVGAFVYQRKKGE